MDDQKKRRQYGRCPTCNRIGPYSQRCDAGCSEEEESFKAAFIKSIREITERDLYHLGILTEQPSAYGNCTVCYRRYMKGYACMDCYRDIMNMTDSRGYYDPFFVARYYKIYDWQRDECDNVVDKNSRDFDVSVLDVSDEYLGSTAATRGKNGTVARDLTESDFIEHEKPAGENVEDGGGGDETPDISRHSYFGQPEPAFGTDGYILEAIEMVNLDESKPFNEAMYIRLKEMTAGNLERFHI